MCACDGAVDASQSQLRFPLRDQMGHDLVPYPADRPTAEPQIRMVPIAEFGRDRTPFRAIIYPPDDRFDGTTVFSPRPCATNVSRRDRRLEFRPLRVRQNLHRLSTPTIKRTSCGETACAAREGQRASAPSHLAFGPGPRGCPSSDRRFPLATLADGPGIARGVDARPGSSNALQHGMYGDTGRNRKCRRVIHSDLGAMAPRPMKTCLDKRSSANAR